jgi:hypothetical protein
MTLRLSFLETLFHEMNVCTEKEIEDMLAILPEVDERELVLGPLDDDLKQLQACITKLQTEVVQLLKTALLDEQDELLKQIRASTMHNTVLMLSYVLAREVYARFNISHIAIGPQKWGPCKARKGGTIIRIPSQEPTMVVFDESDPNNDSANADSDTPSRTLH